MFRYSRETSGSLGYTFLREKKNTFASSRAFGPHPWGLKSQKHVIIVDMQIDHEKAIKRIAKAHIRTGEEWAQSFLSFLRMERAKQKKGGCGPVDLAFLLLCGIIFLFL